MANKTEKDFRISKSGLSDYEADTLFPIALNIDLCFRKSVYQYDIHNSDEQKQRERIADIIYNCESAEIKRLLQKINTQESRSILNMIADYEGTYAKSFYTLYKLKPEYKSEQSGSVEKMRREHNYIDKSKYFPAYSEKITKDTEPMGIDLYLLAAYAADKSSYTAEHKDVIVITRHRTESAYFNELSGYVPVPEFTAVQMSAAAISNYNGCSAFIGNDGGVYLGKSENYMFNRENGYLPFYKNTDNSLLFISDNKTMFQFISGTGWTLSQDEMLKRGFFTENDYAEFAKLEKGVLAPLDKIREITFDGKSFKDVFRAEKMSVKQLLDELAQNNKGTLNISDKKHKTNDLEV